jgi:phage baseplate assembly protein W
MSIPTTGAAGPVPAAGEQRLGTDLALTTLFAADEWGAHDLGPVLSRRGRRVTVALQPDGSIAPDPTDLATLSGRQNLAQSLILRLLTPLGWFGPLGHPGYGSRLGELVGHSNDPVARLLARRHVLEAMAQESRAQLVDLAFDDPAISGPGTLAFTAVVQPLLGGAPAGQPIGLTVAVEL